MVVCAGLISLTRRAHFAAFVVEGNGDDDDDDDDDIICVSFLR